VSTALRVVRRRHRALFLALRTQRGPISASSDGVQAAPGDQPVAAVSLVASCRRAFRICGRLHRTAWNRSAAAVLSGAQRAPESLHQARAHRSRKGSGDVDTLSAGPPLFCCLTSDQENSCGPSCLTVTISPMRDVTGAASIGARRTHTRSTVSPRDLAS